jgi:hypothetical protein
VGPISGLWIIKKFINLNELSVDLHHVCRTSRTAI